MAGDNAPTMRRVRDGALIAVFGLAIVTTGVTGGVYMGRHYDASPPSPVGSQTKGPSNPSDETENDTPQQGQVGVRLGADTVAGGSASAPVFLTPAPASGYIASVSASGPGIDQGVAAGDGGGGVETTVTYPADGAIHDMTLTATLGNGHVVTSTVELPAAGGTPAAVLPTQIVGRRHAGHAGHAK